MTATPRTHCTVALLIAVSAVFAEPRLRAQDYAPPQVAFTYAAQRSIVTGSGDGFWLQGVAGEVTVPVHRSISLAANAAFVRNGQTTAGGSALDLVTFAAGPRLTIHAPYLDGRHTPMLFAQALLGFTHGYNSIFPEATSPATSATSFALVAGGGIDVPLSHRVGLRIVEADYTRTTLPNGAGNVQNDIRLGAGLTFALRSR